MIILIAEVCIEGWGEVKREYLTVSSLPPFMKVLPWSSTSMLPVGSFKTKFIPVHMFVKS